VKENLFPALEQTLAPLRPASPTRPDGREVGRAARQSFDDYRRSRPARRTARRHAVYLSRVGALTVEQESVVADTAEYLAAFLDLPVRPGADIDPETFPPDAFGRHPTRGHPQLRTAYLLNEALRLDRPEEALVCLAVTA
jgi:hypothetical protein